MARTRPRARRSFVKGFFSSVGDLMDDVLHRLKNMTIAVLKDPQDPKMDTEPQAQSQTDDHPSLTVSAMDIEHPVHGSIRTPAFRLQRPPAVAVHPKVMSPRGFPTLKPRFTS